ncbi:hypothetical protein MOO45_06920 [Bombilactobacillus folatiphilus]|uniref:Lipoprotein n=1 Tax=Bombilactobacillus folatiphilus TaxID=2923362 RepID=A0ABY4P8R2_9LACO|nr:hypothetical protein [Bombilactobacillus folatiphilus]UQS81916.1 hypothetical protein MOO45_06920 [Bombilactobacillus folatiphilus]
MFNKKLTVAIAGVALLVTGCSNSNSGKDSAKPFSAQTTKSTQAFKQEITGNSDKGSKVYYQVASNKQKSVTVKNQKYTIKLPIATKNQTVKVSQSKSLKKPITVNVKKPTVIASGKTFANNFNASGKVKGKMASQFPKLSQPLSILFSPTTTYKLLTDGSNIYRMQLSIADVKSNEVKPNVAALASGLKVKNADLTKLVNQAKNKPNKKQTKSLNKLQITALVKNKKLTLDIVK